MNNKKHLAQEKETQEGIQRGVDAIAAVAAAAYGLKGGDVILESSYGDPRLSRDGVTNVSEVHLKDRIENAAAQIVKQASKKTNETEGDATTLTVLTTKYLLDKARQLVGAQVYDRATVSQKLIDMIPRVHARLDKIAKKYTENSLQDVAIISAGEEGLGQLIADSISSVGLDGGVVVERHAGLGIYQDLQDGFYFNKGFSNAWLINNQAQLKSEFNDVSIFITEKQISSMHEIAQVLEKCGNENIKRLLIVGEVTGEAQNVLIQVKYKGLFDVTTVEPPAYAGNRTLFLDDLALVSGGKVYSQGMTDESFDTEMLGKASHVVVTEFNTTIIGGNGNKKLIDERLKALKKDLKESKDPRSVDAIQERLSKITGKICIIRVGGATPSDADYMKLKVDDAVSAVRSAMRSGVLPGGGIALLRAKDAAGDFADAFDQPIKQLMSNAGLNAELYLAEAQKANVWYGFDLKNITDKPVDMLEAGVVDSLGVIKEAVTNAATTAARLINVKAAIIFDDDTNNNPANSNNSPL